MRKVALIALAGLSLSGGQTTMANPTYRSVNFRDSVLNAVMYKAGLDPVKDLFSSDAAALVSFINYRVRKLSNEVDFPEWTNIESRQPDANHVVDLNAPAFTQAPGLSQIDRLLRVYLLDPRTTDGPLDIPFRKESNGVWVGFEHGTTVWLKFMLPPQQFTSRIWKAIDIYSAGDLVYSPSAGECFKSKVNGNRGHDPASAFQRVPVPPEIVQQRTPNNSGSDAVDAIMVIDFTSASPGPPPPDVPSAGTTFYFEVYAKSDPNPKVPPFLVDSVSHVATGAQNLGAIITALLAAAGVPPAGITYTGDTVNKRITVQGNSSFNAGASGYINVDSAVRHLFKISFPQAYTPAVAFSMGQPQVVQISLPAESVQTAATYSLVVQDPMGEQHQVDYVAIASDSSAQILSGLSAAINNSVDTFFQGVAAEVDTTMLTLGLSTLDIIGVEFTMIMDASPYWDKVLFPMVLADAVVRGAYADWLKGEGQHSKGMAEEQLVPAEQSNRAGQEMLPKPNQLTDQMVVEQ